MRNGDQRRQLSISHSTTAGRKITLELLAQQGRRVADEMRIKPEMLNQDGLRLNRPKPHSTPCLSPMRGALAVLILCCYGRTLIARCTDGDVRADGKAVHSLPLLASSDSNFGIAR